MADEPERNDCKWPSAPGFKESWKKFKSDSTTEAMKTFNDCKRSVPPRPLPRGMRDHKLEGPLKDYRECHLEGDILLIYKTLPDGVVRLLRVCTHNDIVGPKAQALAAALKGENPSPSRDKPLSKRPRRHNL
jgi:mRNA interferase YafQ